ncbi:MAG: colanic acid exporter, partial [Pedobacter sp.]
SKNKPNLMFYLNLVSLTVKIPTIYFLSKYFGLMGIAWGFVFTSFVETVMVFIIVKSLVGSFVEQFLRNIVKPLSFCLIMIFDNRSSL